MAWSVKGTFHKRKYLGRKNIYIPEAEAHDHPGKWFVIYQLNKKRHTFCSDTIDFDVAKERWAEELVLINAGKQRVTEDEVELKRRWLMKKVLAGEQANAELHHMTGPGALLKISDVWDAFLSSKLRPVGTSARTLKGYKQQFDRFARWAPGTIKTVRDLVPAYCSRYIDDMESHGLSPNTVSKHLGLLELVWNSVDPDWKNPWKNLHSTKEHVASHFRGFTHAECQRIFKFFDDDACKEIIKDSTDQFKLLILLGYSTGQRLGDLAALKWSQVNMKAKTITISPAKTFRRNKKKVIVPITEQLHKAMVKLPRDGFVMPAVGSMYQTNPSGLPKRIGEVIDKAKVKDTEAGKASFHSFRHTFDSMLANANAPLQVCARLLGHALPGMSEKYIHGEVEVLREWMTKAIKPL